MDIFVQNVPSNATNKEITSFFEGPLGDFGITVYHVEKLGTKPQAKITVLDLSAAQRFLDRYAHLLHPLQRKLYWNHNRLEISRAHHSPSVWSLRSLARQQSQSAASQSAAPRSNAAQQGGSKSKHTTKFTIRSLACGIWEYGTALQEASATSGADSYVPYFCDPRKGSINLGRKEALIVLDAPSIGRTRIDIKYDDCHDITLGTYQDGTVTFNLQFPPKMYELPGNAGMDTIESAFQGMSLGLNTAQPMSLGLNAAAASGQKKVRLPAISDAHAAVAGQCFVYRIVIDDMRHLASIRHLLDRNIRTCPISQIQTTTVYPSETLVISFDRLRYELTNVQGFGREPFDLLYQVERMARNGKLTPLKVLALLPKISEIHREFGLEPTLHAIRRTYMQVPPASPYTRASDLSIDTLKAAIEEFATSYDTHAPGNPYDLARRHAHINLIHKVHVTPAGIVMAGPEPEPTNRVLRRYDQYSDHFIRVIFMDDDGSPVRFDPRTDLGRIYHRRFKGTLDHGVLICGRRYSFLGFSHSSLRSQSCWFMAPLLRGETYAYPPNVLRELGDFDHIRIPAKCAARIGQNFTDTSPSVEVMPDEVGMLPTVERCGRDFSDGVGTISMELLQSVWRRYGSRRSLKPTALQIRFQGAKGMVALDSRLHGKRLMLRSNMKKFETQTSWMLEICGAAFRPLPMILNRQFIKIFEDLGIRMDTFLDMQKSAMDSLRLATKSSIGTAKFLERGEGTKATRLPTLIRHLAQLSLDYHQDSFLYKIVEMMVVSKVRDFKYRGRIPVEQGLTLFGIMDETGSLQPGEIFVITEGSEGGKQTLVQDGIVVTRSPALHPGDIQLANAVDVDELSPLRELSNVVVFSQHGARDLPSQLSGGDLDGDLYNIIFDRRLIPETTYLAAEYPRIAPAQLHRPVNSKDMSDFFVTFMESDQLGVISNKHLQLSDQRQLGTRDPDCIQLAAMASTAVDFSKTGIPVDMRNVPRMDRCRPDFMAPSPRVLVSARGDLDFEENEVDDDDAFEGLDTEQRPMRYYESDKTLGFLFRAIDERQFLAEMQKDRQIIAKPMAQSILEQVLAYAKRYAARQAVLYEHHLELASNIRASYEEGLLDIVYDYEPSPHMPLTEVEVFAGTILGRQGGVQGKNLRELSNTMRERFESVVEYAIMRIVKGDQMMQSVEELDELYETYDERVFEAFPRAIACLETAVTQRGLVDRKVGELRSFRYVAVAVCLRELERFHADTSGGSQGLPRMQL